MTLPRRFSTHITDGSSIFWPKSCHRQADSGSDTSSSATLEPEPEDDLVLQRLARAEAQAREEDEEFNREFNKMMLEQSDTKKGERKTNVPIFDTAVPLMRKAQRSGKAGGMDEDGGGAAGEVDASVTRFMLLTKKGNKPQVCLHLCCRVLLSWTFIVVHSQSMDSEVRHKLTPFVFFLSEKILHVFSPFRLA